MPKALEFVWLCLTVMLMWHSLKTGKQNCLYLSKPDGTTTGLVVISSTLLLSCPRISFLSGTCKGSGGVPLQPGSCSQPSPWISQIFLPFPRNWWHDGRSGSGTAGTARRRWSCCSHHLTQGCVTWLSPPLLWPPTLLSPHVACPLQRIHPAFGVSWQLCQMFYWYFFSFTL